MRKIYTILPAFLLFGWGAVAQSDLLLYHFDALGQSVLLNPAMPQKNRFVLGIPGAAKLSLQADAGLGSINEMFGPSEVTGNAAIKEILDRNDANSALSFSVRYEPLFFGFKTGRLFWSFGGSIRQEFFTRFPYNLVDLAYYGNATPGRESVELGNLNTQFLLISGLHAGTQMQFFQKRLTLGVRVHYLMSNAMVHLRKSSILLTSGLEAWQIETDAEVQASYPGETLNIDYADYNSYLSNNRGLAFDFGAHWKITSRWALSASLNDWGSIRYTDNPQTYRSSGSFTYEGFQFSGIQPDQSLNLENLVDSLRAVVELDEADSSAFTYRLPYNAYLGLSCNLSRRHRLAFLMHHNSNAGWDQNQYLLQYFGDITRWLQVIGSYRTTDINQVGTFGAGFAIKTLWSMQLYAMLSNVTAVYKPFDQQSVGFNFGLNIAIRSRR